MTITPLEDKIGRIIALKVDDYFEYRDRAGIRVETALQDKSSVRGKPRC